jgi:transcriptional regulator with XRE-family HTH domain
VEALDDLDARITALGAALRVERQRQGLTVQALSERSGVSFGLISQLERGRGNPSFAALHRLASALALPLTKFLNGFEDDSMLVRAGEGRLLPVRPEERAQQRVRREVLTPVTQTTLQMIRSTLPVGFTNEAHPYRHLGTETVTVERGSLIVVHGQRRMELGVGDTATYGCSTPHWWANGSDEETVVLGVSTPIEP